MNRNILSGLSRQFIWPIHALTLPVIAWEQNCSETFQTVKMANTCFKTAGYYEAKL